MKKWKTPLRYPGGKSKAVKKLYPMLPNIGEYEEWREPFPGGGSMSTLRCTLLC